jgi:hypothetical protein
MKSFIAALITISILAISGVKIYQTPYEPCGEPKYYKLGTIDPKFDLERSELTETASAAAEIFNLEYGNKLFAYSPTSSELTINFVYDERSALVEDINKKHSEIDLSNQTLKEKIESYENDLSIFLSKLNSYNERVQSYNSQGGAPPDIYDQLTVEQKTLKIEGDALNVRASQLNLETTNFNVRVDDLNQEVDKFNEAISQKPEQGIYNGNDNTITIFFVDNRPELIHTIAHEFGHAILMDHLDDPDAIMYPWTSTTVDLSAKDREELFKVCESIPLPLHWADLLLAKYDAILTDPNLEN